MMSKSCVLSLFAFLSLLSASATQASCRTDYVACSNSCILPGIAGALTSKNTNSLQSCTNTCDRQRATCEIQEERQQQIDAANTARQQQQAEKKAAQTAAERDAQKRTALAEQQQNLSAARQRHKNDMVFEINQIVASAADQVSPVVTISKLKIGDALIGDSFFYIDEASNTAILYNLETRQQRSLAVQNPIGVTSIVKDDSNASDYAVVQSLQPNRKELTFQVFNAQGEPVTGAIQTDVAAYLGPTSKDGGRTFFYRVHNNTVYVYTWLHALLRSGDNYDNDTLPLEMRGYNMQTGALASSLSIPAAQTLSLVIVNGQPVLFAAKPERDQLIAFDAQTGAERYQQPLGIGAFSRKDHLWLTPDQTSGIGAAEFRSQDQKTDRTSWFDLATGNALCRFNTKSYYHPILQKFSAGNQIFNRQCQKETEFAASGASLLPVEKGWASYTIGNGGSIMKLLDAQGNIRVAEPFSSFTKTDRGTLVLITVKQPLRMVSSSGVVSTVNWTPGSSAQVSGRYLMSSQFDNGYSVAISKLDENTVGAEFQKQIVKDEFESTAQYRQRVAKLSLPFSRPVQLGRYDADEQRLQVTLDNYQTSFVVPAEQARSLRNASKVTFEGIAKVLEPGLVEVTNPTLNGDGLAVRIARLPAGADNTGKK